MARHQLAKTVLNAMDGIESVRPSVQFELCYYGLLLLQLCTANAPTLWRCDQADDILEESDMRSLAYYWDMFKLQCVGQIFRKGGIRNPQLASRSIRMCCSPWAVAADLVLWCLQGVATRNTVQHEGCARADSLTLLASFGSCSPAKSHGMAWCKGTLQRFMQRSKARTALQYGNCSLLVVCTSI